MSSMIGGYRGRLIEEVLRPAFPGYRVQVAFAGAGVLLDHMGATTAAGCADMLGRLFQGGGQGGGVTHLCFHGIFPC